jgi:3-hydroxymyristoyl/3-hydroxydecanoyl-(acyl carrier protein) dehydratase
MEHESTLVFAADHPAFAGHFPGFPIVPGVLLLDAMLHAAESSDAGVVTEIAAAKFLRPVTPDQVLALSCSGTPGARIRASISHGGQPVVSAQLATEPLDVCPQG